MNTGVDITIICPAYIKTPMLEDSEAVNTTLDTFKKSFIVRLFYLLSAITPETCARLSKELLKRKLLFLHLKSAGCSGLIIEPGQLCI